MHRKSDKNRTLLGLALLAVGAPAAWAQTAPPTPAGTAAAGAPLPRLADPSGSRAPWTYARRYQVTVALVLKGQIPVSPDDLKALAVAALQRAGVQHSRVTFVDMDPDRAWRTQRQVTYSGHYETGVAGTPEDGHSLPPTDRLDVTLVVERRVDNQADRLHLLDKRINFSVFTETVSVQMAGTVTSLDRNALAAAVTPVTVRKTGLLRQNFEGQEVHLEPFLQTLWFTLSLPVERRGLEIGRLRTPEPLGETYAALQQAADRVVAQLETSAPIPLPATRDAAGLAPGGVRAVTPGAASPILTFVGLSPARTIAYVEGDLAGLRVGDKILLPLRPAAGGTPERGREQTATGVVSEIGRTRAALRVIDPETGHTQPLEENQAVDIARPIQIL